MYKLIISKDRIVKESGMDMYLLLFLKMGNQQEPIVQHLELWIQPGWEGSLGENVYMVCMDESLCCSPETITALLIGYQSVQSLSLIQLFTTPWTSVCQASLSITNSWGLLKLVSIEWVLPSNYLVLCHPILLLPSVFPSITVFSTESVLRSGGQSVGASASTSVLPINIQN